MYYSESHGLADLNQLINPRSQPFGTTTLYIARRINEHGVILANGFEVPKKGTGAADHIETYLPDGLITA